MRFPNVADYIVNDDWFYDIRTKLCVVTEMREDGYRI